MDQGRIRSICCLSLPPVRYVGEQARLRLMNPLLNVLFAREAVCILIVALPVLHVKAKGALRIEGLKENVPPVAARATK